MSPNSDSKQHEDFVQWLLRGNLFADDTAFEQALAACSNDEERQYLRDLREAVRVVSEREDSKESKKA